VTKRTRGIIIGGDFSHFDLMFLAPQIEMTKVTADENPDL